MSDPDPSYCGIAGPVNGYVTPGYQRYYSTESGVPPGTPPDEEVDFPPPNNPPNWPHVPPTLPPDTCPPLASTWASGPPDTGGNEMSYTPPVSEPNDDGIRFPIHSSDVILKQEWHGLASTINPINLQIYNLQLEQIIHNAIAQANATKEVNFSAVGGVASGTINVEITPFYDIQVAVQLAVFRSMLQGTNLWYELVLKPLNAGPFANYYVIETTPLSIVQGIDLGA